MECSDFYLLDELLTSDERDVRDRVRQFCNREVTPLINRFWERGEFPLELLPAMARLNIVGGSIQGYGCPGLSTLACALVGIELARGDGSINGFYGVTSNLAMGSIAAYGSPEQREHWLPQMARLEAIGAFALTEPNTGSDAAHVQTTATRHGEHYILNGQKRWIGNAALADVIVVWARNLETGHINGFLVEKDTPGCIVLPITGKIALRALPHAEIVLDNCAIPTTHRLPNVASFRDTATMLMHTRIGAAADAVGHAVAAFEAARSYVIERQQFVGSASQLAQQQLVQMLGDLTTMQLLIWRVCRLHDQGQLTHGRSSLAKRYCAARARQVVALAREVLGSDGLVLSAHVARHFVDAEAVYTYEGTNEISTLIVGREITGIPAWL